MIRPKIKHRMRDSSDGSKTALSFSSLAVTIYNLVATSALSTDILCTLYTSHMMRKSHEDVLTTWFIRDDYSNIINLRKPNWNTYTNARKATFVDPCSPSNSKHSTICMVWQNGMFVHAYNIGHICGQMGFGVSMLTFLTIINFYRSQMLFQRLA